MVTRMKSIINSIEINNLRRFRTFNMSQLGRVNLVVGKNNSGKTTILEAVSVVSSSIPVEIYKILERRQEHKINKISLLPLFLNPQEPIVVLVEDSLRHVSIQIDQSKKTVYHIKFNMNEYKITDSELSNGEGHLNKIEEEFGDIGAWHGEPIWVGIESLHANQVISGLNQLMLTSHEDLVIQSLQILEPRVRRIAPEIAVDGATRGGVKILLEGDQRPQSITSMGEGIWRILGIILSLIKAEGSTLLIDEIDTGLHYSTLEDLWRIIFEVAEKLDVQVFATTHSSDCWRAFAQAMAEDQDASLQRIEGEIAVAYPPDVLKSADELDLEVR